VDDEGSGMLLMDVMTRSRDHVPYFSVSACVYAKCCMIGEDEDDDESGRDFLLPL
jgi:hypothetical protein